MIDTADTNRLTDKQRADIQAQYRGRVIQDNYGAIAYRAFCADCGVPMVAATKAQAMKAIKCFDCATGKECE
ncbi:MAG: hypothetical protein KF805_12645 [Phycisphaeraceae bacterium]|nr:hypothetical protein [Phycisphaeraceae bacterium]